MNNKFKKLLIGAMVLALMAPVTSVYADEEDAAGGDAAAGDAETAGGDEEEAVPDEVDEDFVEHDEEFHGLKAWVIQHEYDHIEGIVFTDRISPLRRNLLKGKLMNLAKGKYRCAYKTK